MNSFDIIEESESSLRITVNGEAAPVHHARIPGMDYEDFAETLLELYEGHSPDPPDESAEDLLEQAPLIVNRIFPLTQFGFKEVVRESEKYSRDVERAVDNVFSRFSYLQEDWENSSYDASNPAVAEVIAAYISLVNAMWCIHHTETHIESQVSEEAPSIYSEGYFDTRVAQGFCLAFRDNITFKVPKSPIRPVIFRDSDKAIQDAINSTLNLSFDETHLEGLLLADWNKRSCLSAASQNGKKKEVETGMQALEGVLGALENETETESD